MPREANEQELYPSPPLQAPRRGPPGPGERLRPAEPVARDVPGGVPGDGREERLEAERAGHLADDAAHGERLVDQGKVIFMLDHVKLQGLW